MKAIATILMGLGLVYGSSNAAWAVSCEKLAGNCARNGGARADCFDSSRIAQCKKTGQYTAPSGRVWNTNEKCVGGDCASYRGKK